ncbi:MAG: hypothetical protein JO170_16130 [Verrucomicrobia bacterium]|nr:hypothetical protein [Verrucomicrobiota bacterium]
MKPGVYDADIYDGVSQSGVVVVLNDNTVRAFDNRYLCYIGRYTSPNVLPGFVVKYDSNELLEVHYTPIAEYPPEGWFAFLGHRIDLPVVNITIQASWSEPLPTVDQAVRRFDKEQIESLIRQKSTKASS